MEHWTKGGVNVFITLEINGVRATREKTIWKKIRDTGGCKRKVNGVKTKVENSRGGPERGVLLRGLGGKERWRGGGKKKTTGIRRNKNGRKEAHELIDKKEKILGGKKRVQSQSGGRGESWREK